MSLLMISISISKDFKLKKGKLKNIIKSIKVENNVLFHVTSSFQN